MRQLRLLTAALLLAAIATGCSKSEEEKWDSQSEEKVFEIQRRIVGTWIQEDYCGGDFLTYYSQVGNLIATPYDQPTRPADKDTLVFKADNTVVFKKQGGLASNGTARFRQDGSVRLSFEQRDAWNSRLENLNNIYFEPNFNIMYIYTDFGIPRFTKFN